MNVNEHILKGFRDEFEKVSVKLTGKALAVGAGVGALTGLTVGSLKGLAEKKLEKKLKKRFDEKSEIPWAAARGITSAGAGALYALAPLVALAKMKKG